MSLSISAPILSRDFLLIPFSPDTSLRRVEADSSACGPACAILGVQQHDSACLPLDDVPRDEKHRDIMLSSFA